MSYFSTTSSQNSFFVIRASDVCSDSIKKAVSLLMIRANCSREKRSRAQPPDHSASDSRRAASSRSHVQPPGHRLRKKPLPQSHLELNRYLPDHGLAEFRVVHLAVTAQRYCMNISDYLLMADATGAVAVAKL